MMRLIWKREKERGIGKHKKSEEKIEVFNVFIIPKRQNLIKLLFKRAFFMLLRKSTML